MRDNAAAAERQQPFRDAHGPGTIVFDPARLRQAGPQWLDAATYGPAAQPVASGGRGAAWFVSGDFGPAVLRRYRRGGLAARISRDRYLWRGEEKVRSVAEFRLLAALQSEGLPVPPPLLAGYWREGLFYRAAILVERIPGASSLADRVIADAASAPWEATGRMIARFHAAGVDHADLNAHNILFDAAGTPWLIDFDRGRRRAPESAWQHANLDRLARSVAKIAPPGADVASGMKKLRAAYATTTPRGAA